MTRSAGSASTVVARMGPLWSRVDRFVGTRQAAIVCFVAALAVYGVESIAWPLSNGRDSATYLMYYVDIWHAHPAYPFLMLFRTPLAPLFFGVLLQLGGAALAEVAMAFAYALSILAFVLAARSYGRPAALVTALALLLFPAYGALFHQVSSDPIFALTFALWTLAAVRALREPAPRRYALCALAFVAMVLARPGAEVLLAFGFVPLVMRGGGLRMRITSAAVYVGLAVALLVSWSAYNDLRYGDFTVARSVWVGTPFYRTFVMEKTVKPANGPASRELAQVVGRDLLTRRPYKSEHVSIDRFFSVAGDRMWGDLVVLSDQHWGWQSNYAILRRVGIEAVRRHPKLYMRDVASGMWSELISPYRWGASRLPDAPPTPAQRRAAATESTDLGGYRWWLESTPGGRPAVAARVARQHREITALANDLPNRSGSAGVANVLNGLSRIFPRMAIWLGVGILALLVRRRSGPFALLTLVAAALLMLFITLLGYGPTPEYGLPLDPVFILFGATALAARRDPSQMSPA